MTSGRKWWDSVRKWWKVVPLIPIIHGSTKEQPEEGVSYVYGRIQSYD